MRTWTNYSKDLINAVDEYKSGATSSAVPAEYSVSKSTVRNRKCSPTIRIGDKHP